MPVDGIRTTEMAETLVASGTPDYISLCRPFIRESDLEGSCRRVILGFWCGGKIEL
jgi:2,4-dienoyl-CoA reductase-like NADH-dependent reductase (Old Yellow Enzyme family)